MYLFATVTVFTIVSDLVFADNKLNLMPQDSTSNEQSAAKDNSQSSTTSNLKSSDVSSINSIWVYRPNTRRDVGDAAEGKVLRPGISVTRLAKSLYYGFDPYFHRIYFEPFETRPKPVRLVAINRNGRMPRDRVRVAINDQANVAELQSPFNEVGNFWLEDSIRQ